MAIMWPQTIPSWISSDPRRSAEIEVFRRLAEVLDDGWEVFYSRPWWGITPRGGEVDGEADFIVAHPDRGFLFLEVKGGRIGYAPDRAQWTSKDRNGITFNIKDPASQAMVCKHRYIDTLRKTLGWPTGYIRFRHGVVFPDSSDGEESSLSFGGYDRSLFCLASQFDSSFRQWLEARLSAHVAESERSECPPGTAGVEILRRLVADPVRLRVPLKRSLGAENAQLEQLVTGQQLHVITLLDSFPRAVIEGGAGTGKTLLALEMAARIAATGKRVCLMSYNVPIAEWMKQRISSYPLVTAGTFHSMCGKLASAAGFSCNETGQEFYNSRLPALAVKALDAISDPPYDAVLVDEGQDFLDDWWAVVTRLVPRGDSGMLRVFYDSNQSLYRNSSDIATTLGAQTFTLKQNLRNTKAISAVTDHLYRGPQIFSMGPEGKAPVARYLGHAETWNDAKAIVVDLVRHESLAPGDIAVLLPGENEAVKFRGDLSSLGVISVAADRATDDAVTVDTVRRFKGLEALVTILIASRSGANEPETAYVAVSRAKTRLYILGNFAGTLLERALQESGYLRAEDSRFVTN